MRRKPRKLLLVLAFFLSLSGCRGKEVIGTPAIEFAIEWISGGQITYASLKGKPVLLYFFASW